ncbi:hypothetical protein SUGI_0530100 [Cryptomeria japonica]|nr:hypothetical protein SUGI_0530100 [Cryptomeria japonica]
MGDGVINGAPCSSSEVLEGSDKNFLQVLVSSPRSSKGAHFLVVQSTADGAQAGDRGREGHIRKNCPLLRKPRNLSSDGKILPPLSKKNIPNQGDKVDNTPDLDGPMKTPNFFPPFGSQGKDDSPPKRDLTNKVDRGLSSSMCEANTLSKLDALHATVKASVRTPPHPIPDDVGEVMNDKESWESL